MYKDTEITAVSSGQISTGTPGAPLLSVVIPTYHRNDLLLKCLECLAPGRQTLDACLYEVVVTDDGKQSTAETLIAERFPWAKWVKGPQKGPASNRNNGASYTRGEWIAFTDDDCLPEAGWLAAFYSAAGNKRNVPNVLEGRTVCKEGVKSLFQHSPTNESGGALWSCNMMVRRAFFDRLNGFDENFPSPHLEDVDFRERVYGLEEKITFVADAIVDHPPRPAHFGNKLGPLQESEFLFYYKSGHQKPYLIQHLRRMIALRLLLVRRYPLSQESVRALLFLLPELMYVVRNGNHWQRQYREKYRNTTTIYPPDLAARSCQH